ncbi:CHAP domain-containing protein [Lyngbya confervoides]|uniref:CHAP domain-containing protein n=1 Tax=Lyngbya confervoides BDU141951 TaxID=1574623 RepID=A0ABD4T5S5_9CYAN|nr:CHAP domain-containing protein [Lyngbya confervoides]MCM1983773.1 CHAP domain-containing protein [Lyngbya confervoides BDU141951]
MSQASYKKSRVCRQSKKRRASFPDCSWTVNVLVVISLMGGIAFTTSCSSDAANIVSAESPAARAVSWAAKQVGQRSASDPAKSYWPLGEEQGDWAPGYRGEWSGDCAKFVFSAWRFGAGIDIYMNDASKQYHHYKAQIQHGAPPAGAIVFWPDLPPFGHIAISDGLGGIYTTEGLDGDNLPIAHLTSKQAVQTFGTPAGWVLPHGSASF